MIPFATPMLGGSSFASFSAVYTSTQTVTPPIGATKAFIEGYGAGGYGSNYTQGGNYQTGGCGGHYAAKTLSLSGVTALYVAPGLAASGASGGNSLVRIGSSSGTIVMLAAGGQQGSTLNATGTADIGDVSYPGGSTDGGNGGSYGGGGGCAGPNGAGAAGNSGGTGGFGGGGLAGAGGTGGLSKGTAGSLYGGGGSNATLGAQGAIKITWR